MSRAFTIFWLVFGLIQSAICGLYIYAGHYVVLYTVLLFLFAITVGGNITILAVNEYDD